MRFFAKKATLAAAISLATGVSCAEAAPRGKIRLELNDVISSRPEVTRIDAGDKRIAFNGLIQSHPDPLYLALEKRYQALPPFTAAFEEIPDQLIAEASFSERLSEGLRDVRDEIPAYMPRISSSIKYDDSTGAEPGEQRSTTLAMINPTFEHAWEQRKWQLAATYDLEHNQSYGDLTDSFTNHSAKLDWALKINRQSELRVSSTLASTHDQELKDPILDFDSATQSDDLQQDRYLLNLSYRRGTERDRTRYNVFYTTEWLDVEDNNSSDYSIDRHVLGGSYTWQAKKQLALVAEGRVEDADSTLSFRANNHYQALAGPDVVFGRRIRARLRMGYESKRFDDALSGNSFGEPIWRGGLEWALRRSTSVSLETGREIYELASIDEKVDTSAFNVRDWVKTTWNEQWSSRLKTSASYTYRENSVFGAAPGNEEAAQQLILSAVFRFTDKLRFAIDSAFTRESDSRRRTFTLRTDYSL